MENTEISVFTVITHYVIYSYVHGYQVNKQLLTRKMHLKVMRDNIVLLYRMSAQV